MKVAVAAACLALCAVPARADAMMETAANAFYGVSVGVRPVTGGGIPDASGRARFAPLLSARLNQQLVEAAAAETRFRSRHKSSPPLIEGDIFSSLFEGPTAFKVSACAGDAVQARCTVALTHQIQGQKPASWNDTLILVNQSGWKVDDVAYDAHFAFGNTGTLSQTLKMVVAQTQ